MDELILLLNLQAQTTFGNAGGSECTLSTSVSQDKDNDITAKMFLQ